MKKVFSTIVIVSSCMVCPAQNVGINTTAPQAYGHGGTNRVLELKNDAGTGSDIQSHLILSTNGTAGSLGSITWAAPNITGAEKRSGLISNTFETTNATRLAFYTRTEAGSVTEKFSITGNGNVGIGTNTPGFPLNFTSTLGDKISLYGNSGNHFGLGIQNSLLQIHTDIAGSNIAFGYGSSGNLTERMRILNNTGYDGMSLNGRLLLKNGSTDLVGGGGGVWLYKADNSSQLGFMGTQNNQNIGFYGGPGGWGFTYDAINSRVGIGNNNPNAPLAFPPSLGKKITLYPGATGDVGFGVAGNRLQIYADNPNADVAIGYDAAGTFNERFAVKPTGALALNGNVGAPGQVLQSNGGSAATWTSGTNDLYNRTVQVKGTNSVLINSYTLTDVPGLNYSFNVPGNARVLVNLNVIAWAPACALCGFSKIDLRLNLDGADVSLHQYVLTNGEDMTMTGNVFLQVGAGNHTLNLRAAISGPAVSIGTTPSIFSNDMIIQVIQQ